MAFPQAGGLNLHARIVDEFGRLIVEGQFGADQPIVPEDVSPVPAPRTVVREALRVLESRGMVTASELLELRVMIEPAGHTDGRTAPQTRRSSRRWRPQRADVRSRRRRADSLVMPFHALTMVLAKNADGAKSACRRLLETVAPYHQSAPGHCGRGVVTSFTGWD
jgi:DNA-binding FadR family transcriptional regulator